MTKPTSPMITVAITRFVIKFPKLNQRLTGLYEDIGHVLNRYYDIDEAMDPVGKEDGDIDNDGDKDDSDQYLAKRRKAIAKAIKNGDK